ncbi:MULTISPECIES: AsmA family protein [Shewanella]|uniref:AsmA family protein n=1 Tax=Shewanella marisflavi TaxID=260364 RepID=A0ABX5WL27_9GAMM|nr:MULTISPECIES: AsmA family protein [Shewanella]QDF75179.1 AsmA family protein [Shewanella marisflavi]
MKFLKWLLIVFASLFLLLAAYLTLIFDPNDFKPQIVEAVKKQTGRTLTINQDLSWTFFPSIGIALGDISLSNPKGFKNDTMLKVDGIVAEVALLPLLSKEVEIAQLNLDGLTLNYDSYKNGRTSLDGLTSGGDKAGAEQAVSDSKPAEGSVQLSSLNIGGIAITNTQVNLFDEATGKVQALKLEALTLGAFSLDKFADISFKFSMVQPEMTLTSEGNGEIKVDGSLAKLTIKDFVVENIVEGDAIPNKRMQMDLTSQIELDNQAKTLAVVLSSLSLEQIKAQGKLAVNYGAKVPDVVASMSFGDIDLTPYMAKGEAAKADEKDGAASASAQEPDLTGMKAVNLKLDLDIKSVVADKIKTENWLMKLMLKNGVLDVNQLSADLYQGKLLASAQLDGRKKVASYRFDKKISGIQVRPLLTDAAEVDMLAGTTNFEVAGSGFSLIPDNIKRNLNAKGQFEIADGSLYGVNIPQMLRDAKAKLAGDLNATSAGEKKTDFTSLTGSFTMAKGQVTNPDLNMASPLIRLQGKGNVNLLSEAIDYALKTSVVGSLEGQGSAEKDELYGLEIPFAISGTISEPKFALDTAALFDAKLKKEAEKATDDLKDKLFKKLGGF